MEEEDLPQLFGMCRDIMRATDREVRGARLTAVAAARKAATGDGEGDPAHQTHQTSQTHQTAVAPRTIWWHQIVDPDETDGREPASVEEWVVCRELKRTRMRLMNSRGGDGAASLEKVRQDFLLYARDAYLS